MEALTLEEAEAVLDRLEACRKALEAVGLRWVDGGPHYSSAITKLQVALIHHGDIEDASA